MKRTPRHARRPNQETRDSLLTMMRNITSESHTPTDFVGALPRLLVTTTIACLGTLACAGTVTPPDSTPVYADDIAAGVTPVEVEHQSTNRPDPENPSADKEETTGAEKKESSAEKSDVGIEEEETETTPEPAAPESAAPESAAPEPAPPEPAAD